MKLKEYTIEDLRTLEGIDKFIAKERYAKWREEQRKEDRKEKKRMDIKVQNFKYRRKNPEKVKECKNRYNLKLKERIKNENNNN